MFKPLKEGERPVPFAKYHAASIEIGDVDPSYAMLRYLCDRFELNIEQRFWLAFLYATCYCGPTVYYIYNEFPDFENVDEGRLKRWWEENKEKLYFQTDRRRIKSNDQFVQIFRSYKEKIGGVSQRIFFNSLKSPHPDPVERLYHTYEIAWNEMSDLYQFGRFSMFLYLEAVHVVTGFPMLPRSMDIKDAESCRNGLAYALQRPQFLTGDGKTLSHLEMLVMQNEFDLLVKRLREEDPRNNVWNIETTLCAYKKYVRGDRWVGYYLDRQHDEIKFLEESVKDGVDWSVLWDYRMETYKHDHLKEIQWLSRL